ncbi:cytochrome c3 family protein [Eggerthella sinensis]|nr:cytochrome c3 family protein [Eggerthella sinensis]
MRANRMRLRRSVLVLGVVALIGGASVAGCAPQQPGSSGEKNAAAAEAVSVSWSPTVDCMVCHVDQASSMDDATCLAGAHVSEGLTCSSCHGDDAGLASVHEGVTTDDKTPKRLKTTKVTNDGCLSCHEKGDLLSRAADYIGCTDEDGLTVNPHDLPDTPGHVDVRCVDCHRAHERSDPLGAAPELCLGCHHYDKYECYTCHE